MGKRTFVVQRTHGTVRETETEILGVVEADSPRKAVERFIGEFEKTWEDYFEWRQRQIDIDKKFLEEAGASVTLIEKWGEQQLKNLLKERE